MRTKITPKLRSIMVASVGSGDASKSNRHSKQEWIPVRGKKGGNQKKRFETKIGEDNSNLVYMPYNGRARVVFAGVAPHEKHACNHVPFPKSSNENGNRRFRKRKCVKKKPVQRQVKPTRQSATRVKNEWVKFEKLLSEFQPEESKLLSGGLEATHQKLQRNSKHIVSSLESTQKACQEIEKSITIERTFYDKLYQMHLKRIPKTWQQEAQKVYMTALTWQRTNDGNQASSNEAPEVLMAPFKSLGAGQCRLDQYHKVFHEFHEQYKKFKRLTNYSGDLTERLRYHNASLDHHLKLETKQCRFLHSQRRKLARTPHLSFELLRDEFYRGLHQDFGVSNETRAQFAQTQMQGHTFDRIERAFAASSISSPNLNDPILISNMDLTIGPQGSSIADSAFLPGPSNQTGGGSNEETSTVRAHGDQASVRVYGSNDNASHPSDEQRETDLDTAAVLQYLRRTAPNIASNFEQLLNRSAALPSQNSKEEEDDSTSSVSNSSISSTLEKLLRNYKSLNDDIKNS